MVSITGTIGVVCDLAITSVATHSFAFGISTIALDIGAIGSIVCFYMPIRATHPFALGITSADREDGKRKAGGGAKEENAFHGYNGVFLSTLPNLPPCLFR